MSLPKLGRRPVRRDPRTLKLHRYRLATIPPAPASCDWSTQVHDWGEMLNDNLGDCTCAAAGHLIQLWSADQGAEVVLPDSAILAAYEAVSGYRPGDPSTDSGAVELDVLNYWRQTGVGNHKIDAFAAVAPSNADHVREACWLFGGLYIGLALPVSAQTQDIWDVPPGGAVDDGAPGSWGGHAVPVVGYDADGLTVIAWGAVKRMTWPFWSAYCDEAYAIISLDWLGAHGTPQGYDLAALDADFAAVTG